MKNWITNIFKGKQKDLLIKSESYSAVATQPETTVDEKRITRIKSIEAQIQMNRMYDTVVGMDVYLSLPEVFFPINFIASRISSAHYEIRKNSDDSIVWCANRSKEAKGVARLLTKPNWLQSWKEFAYMHWVQKLATGNGFMRAAMNSDLFDENTSKWEWCKNLWTIPSSMMTIETPAFGRGFVNMFGCEDMVDVILGYKINGQVSVPYWQIFHDRDLFADIGMGKADFLWSPSRLLSTEKNMTILRRVYDARNTIYDKCGALGIITNRAQDETGSVAMTPQDKKELNDHYSKNYGPSAGKSSTLITNANVDYLKTGADISQLMPFDETLEDAIAIAGIFDIPAVLVPRKDQSTFNNQAAAEKKVYTSTIIPFCQDFCNNLTNFLGLKDYYIWCNFDDVDCLQAGRKEEEQVKKLVNDRCRQQFIDGLICFNDWRAQIHESAFEGEIFNKTKMEMSDEEREYVDSIISIKSNISNSNNKSEDGKEDEKSEREDSDK